MPEEQRLRNEGTDSARTEDPSQDGDDMDEKNSKIAHQRMVAGRRILRNLGRNNNSPGTRLWHLQKRDRSLRGKRQAARLKFVNANTPDFNPENEGLHPKQILDYTHAKDGNGKVVYDIEAFVWIREACGYKFRPIFAQIARAFCTLFARYRY